MSSFIRVFLVSLFCMAAVSGCIQRKERNLLSPCVGAEWVSNGEEARRAPCVRRPANPWLTAKAIELS